MHIYLVEIMMPAHYIANLQHRYSGLILDSLRGTKINYVLLLWNIIGFVICVHK